MFVRHWLAAVLVGVLLAFTGCGGGGSSSSSGGSSTLSSISVTPTNPSIANGTMIKFTATGIYSDSTTKDLTASVTWTSSQAAIAPIDGSAQATGLSAGTSTVTATYEGISGNTSLTVTTATLSSISVTPANPIIAKGTSKQFAAAGTFSDGSTQDLTSQATWSSSDINVITVDGSGYALALVSGQATVTAVFGSISGTSTVAVTAATLSSISVTPVNASIPKGTTQQFTATGTFSDGTTQDLTAQASWSASTSSTTMGAMGMMGMMDGGGMGGGGMGGGGGTTPSTAVSIDSTGLATALSAGTATISATIGTVSGSTTLTVTAATISSISVTPIDPSIPKGLKKQFSAVGTYTDSTTKDITSAVTWSSSDAAVATVSSAMGSYGLATSLSEGTVTITATDAASGISGSTSLTVTSAQLASVKVTPASPSVPKGLTQQFTATGTYTDLSTQDLTTSVTWGSSNASAATVSNSPGSNGLATSVAPGTTTISATNPGDLITGSTTLTVTSAALASISSVVPASQTIAKGLGVQFSATGVFTDASTSDITALLTWSSSDTAVASISNAAGSKGIATAVGIGTATITATHAATGLSISATLTVTDAQLASITLNPANATIPKGGTRLFTATGKLTDGTILPLLNTALTWSSFDSGIAGISNVAGSNGLATSVSVGTTIISATEPASGIIGSTNLTVSTITAISAGYSHTVAIRSDDTVWNWGGNAYGQLGDGTKVDRYTPVKVNGITGVIAAAAGDGFTLFMRNDGTVWSIGNNASGQLGNGSTSGSSVPVQVNGLTGIILIAAGQSHSLALRSDGIVYGWGNNSNGQLGDGTTTSRTAPVIAGDLIGVTSIAAGQSHSLALKAGSIWAWGGNTNGQLGDGTTTQRNVPVQVTGLTGVTAVAAGVKHSLALKNDGTVSAWGYNGDGALGDGTITDSPSPVAVSGLTGVASIASHGPHSLAITSGGAVWAWGENLSGEIGDGTTTNSSTPFQAGGLTSVTSITGGGASGIGYGHSVALKNDGTVWTWGGNASGQLGDGTTTNSSAPNKVNGL